MKALLLDVGNTRLKWGIGEDGRIAKTGDIAQQKIREQGLGVLTTRLPRNVEAVIASNVAGATFATRLAGVIGAHCGRDLHFAKVGRAAFGITNSYSQPRRMGVDRWVAMIGARADCDGACLVVDAGTAVTIDAVDAEGMHLGGMILPGVAMMAAALAADTSDIPAVTLPKNRSFAGMDMFAQNTRDAVASGALQAVAGAVERTITALESGDDETTVFLTGGDASRILSLVNATPLHRPHLVLQGLLHMLQSDRRPTR